MALQLRVSLPDQPGALARLAHTIARAGADVISVAVMESEAGRAVDDFRLRWPDGKDAALLTTAVQNCQGVQVVGCRRTRWLHDGRPDLDMFSYLLTATDRGLETLVAMAPVALDADWAELRAPARHLPPLFHSSPETHDNRVPEVMPVRAIASQDATGAWACFPLAAVHSILIIGRDGGPGFLRSEIVHAERVLEFALRLLDEVDPVTRQTFPAVRVARGVDA
jgi:hypothetical protein